MPIAKTIINEGFISGIKPYWLGKGIYFFTFESKAKCWMLAPSRNKGEATAVIRLIVIDEDIEKYLLNLDDKAIFDTLIEKIRGLYRAAMSKNRRESIKYLDLLAKIKPYMQTFLETEDEQEEIKRKYEDANRSLGCIINIVLDCYDEQYGEIKIIRKSFANPEKKRRTSCFPLVEEIFCIREQDQCNLYKRNIC